MIVELFLVLLISGLMLVGAEVFIPGGVLGAVGGIALVGAIITAFVAFPPMYAGYITAGILVLVGVVIVLWIKYFPRSPIGKLMTVSRDLRESKGTQDGLALFLGKTGEALSDLRPSGFARIDGHRVDVITQGGMISKGESVKVVEVEANRVVVARIDQTNVNTEKEE